MRGEGHGNIVRQALHGEDLTDVIAGADGEKAGRDTMDEKKERK